MLLDKALGKREFFGCKINVYSGIGMYAARDPQDLYPARDGFQWPKDAHIPARG